MSLMEDSQQSSVQQETPENASQNSNGTHGSSGSNAFNADAQDAPSRGASDGSPSPSPLEAIQNELKDAKSKYLYLYAEFENYKKRAIKERSEYIKFGHESFMRELLSVKDGLERALQFAGDSPIVTGLKLINDEFEKTLERFGTKAHSALGQKFDPTLHEAIGQEPQVNQEKIGFVVREEQKGYSLHGRLIRPSRVVVGIGVGAGAG